MFWSKEKQSMVKLFKKAWLVCEERGYCDTYGGFEYRKIKRHWIKSNYPKPIHEFIRKQAN